MNDAHLHLVVNHLPIVSLLIGSLVLITGFLLKKTEIKLTAFGIYIFGAITSIAAFKTGEAAEEIVENISGISETLVYTHEVYAETFFTLILILGALSIINFAAELKKMKFTQYVTLLLVIVVVAASIFAKYVGTSGGEIRHSEIRDNAKVKHLEID